MLTKKITAAVTDIKNQYFFGKNKSTNNGSTHTCQFRFLLGKFHYALIFQSEDLISPMRNLLNILRIIFLKGLPKMIDDHIRGNTTTTMSTHSVSHYCKNYSTAIAIKLHIILVSFPLLSNICFKSNIHRFTPFPQML